MPQIALKALALSELPVKSVGVITENADVQLTGDLPEGEALLFFITDTWSSLMPKDLVGIKEKLRKLVPADKRCVVLVLGPSADTSQI
jgi:hypothetical protein